MKREKALVYLAAGMSKRFGGRIKSLEVVGPNNKTLIEYSLDQALKSEFSKIIFVVNKKIESFFIEKFSYSYNGIPIFYAIQSFDEKNRDRPWGTADALLSAKSFLDCPFVVCNGDDIYGESAFRILANHLDNEEKCATIGFKLTSVLPESGEVNRGLFEIENSHVKNIQEIYNISRSNFSDKGLNLDSLCSMNIYALNPEVLKYLDENLKNFKERNKEDRKIESLIQNELSELIKNKKIEMKIYPSNDSWIGITHIGDEIKVREFVKNNQKREIAVVYLLAGMSSRFDYKNKSLEVVGPEQESLIEYSMDQIIPLGVSKIIFIVGEHNELQFRKDFGNNYQGIPIKYMTQEYDKSSRDRPWGTGDAVCSLNEINIPFIVCSGDDIYGKQNLEMLFNHLKISDDEATVGIKLKEMVPESGKVNRGIFRLDGNSVLDIHETCGISREDLESGRLDKESFCSMSLFALHPRTLSLLKEKLAVFKKKNINDRRIEFFLPEALAELIKENKIKMKFYPAKNRWCGITNVGDEIILRKELKK